MRRGLANGAGSAGGAENNGYGGGGYGDGSMLRYNLSLIGACGNGLEVRNGVNGEFEGIRFGKNIAGYRIAASGVVFTGNSYGNAVCWCEFKNVGWNGIDDSNVNPYGKLLVMDNEYGFFGNVPIARRYGGLTSAFSYSAICDGAGGTDLGMFISGPPSATSTLEIYGAYKGYLSDCPVGGRLRFTTDVQLKLSGQFDDLIKLPFMKSGYSISGTVTIDGDTTAFFGGTCVEGPCGSLKLDATASTRLNHFNSGLDADPVDALSGEFTDLLPPDLRLGGPFPLEFQRYYAAFLARDNQIQGTLGTNWLHNFEMKLTSTSNFVEIVTALGRVINFTNDGSGWSLIGRRDIPFQLSATPTTFSLGDPVTERLFTFSTNGQLTAISDSRGNTHALAYNNGRLTSVSDGLGRMLAFQYDGNGWLTNVSDGTRSVSFTQSNGLLASARDALGFVTANSYTSTNGMIALATTMVRPEGNAPFRQDYDAFGQVVQQTDALSNQVQMAYSGATTTITDPGFRTRTQMHNEDGELVGLIDESGRKTDIGYNFAGQRTSVFDRDANLTRMSIHNPSGKVAALTRADGTATVFTYTNRTVNGVTFYDPSRIEYPDGTSENFVRDAGGNVLQMTDRGGYLWSFSYDTRGQLLSATNPAGGVVTYTYDAKGNRIASTDSDTGVTTYQYDSLSRLTNVVNPDNTTLRVTYDADDRLLTATDERGHVTAYAYDRNGNTTNVVDAAGNAVRFVYDNMDRLVRRVDTLGNPTGFGYDNRRLFSTHTNRNGFVTHNTYDNRRRLESVELSKSQFWSFNFDEEGLMTARINPLGQATYYGHDRLGYLTSVTNPLNQVTRYMRDSLHRVTNVVDSVGRNYSYDYDSRGLLTRVAQTGFGSASYQYDSLGQLAQITDLNGSQWRFRYTPMGRAASLSDPLNRTNTYAYDSRGRMARIVYPDGIGETNTYDSANELVRRHFSDGLDLQFAYDTLNRLTNANDVAMAYDPEGRLTNETVAGLRWGASYDADGRLTNVSYANGAFSVTYAYDEFDRVTNVQDSLTGTSISFQYDQANRLIGINRPNGMNGHYTYDSAGRLSQITEGNFNSFIDITYNLNAVGEVVRADSTAPMDPQSYLIPGSESFTYDAAHQISKPGYNYDARGRLVASPGHTYAYDGATRLTRIDGTTFGYDGLDDLVTRSSGGVTTRYYHHGAIGLRPIVAERDESTHQFIRYYVWAPNGRLLYLIDAANGNAVRFYHFDRVGTTLALTDSAGNVTDAYAWTPYGQLLAHTGSSQQPFTYIGRFGVVRDNASGLCQMRARWYDPITARFLTRDPVWPQLEQLRTLDPYQYAAQDPLSYIDPNGQRVVGLNVGQAYGLQRGDSALHPAPRRLLTENATSTVTPVPAKPHKFNPDELSGAEALNLGYGQFYPIRECGLEKLPYGFIKEFTAAAMGHYRDSWSVASGDLNNAICTVTLGLVGDGCGAWRTWMIDWLNLKSTTFKAFSWSKARIYMTSERFGLGIHRIIRFQWVCGGDWYILDPWSDINHPIWREDKYKVNHNVNIFDGEGNIISRLNAPK